MVRWTELALKVAQAKRLGDTREGSAAMAELAPLAVQTARRIHAALCSLRKQRAADFVAQAPALVWKKIDRFEDWYHRELSPEARANPPKDWFSAWCYVELRYRYLDQGRDQADEQRVRPLTADGADTARRPADDLAADSGGDFDLSPDDLERIRHWDPLDGVILFCLTGQWDKVPADLWADWTEALGLTAPFPPARYLHVQRTKRRAELASLLNVSRDVIYQRSLRLKLKVREQLKVQEQFKVQEQLHPAGQA